MAKVKTAYYCQNCGTQYPQWHGQCKNCGEWNTLVEEVIEKSTSKNYSGEKKQHIINIIEVNAQEEPRIATPSDELNRVLGGGIVLGSVTLIGGEPGIGKSTLLLQLALKMRKRVLYVSGEESASQIKMRADRLTDLQNPECFLFTETSVDKILHEAKKLQPQFMILDSIQTLHSSLIESSPGTVSQIRECSSEIIKFAKETNTPVFLVGHITKDGQIAGPKVLEHMVDVVLNFDGDRNHLFRLLRANKNRFGSTSEIGIYEMISQGLKEIKNPSEILITKKFEELSGNSVAVTLEGNRPMLLEIQALVSTAVYGTPQRSCTGFDAKRLNMLLAVLEKRAGFQLGSKDVFLNITGGIKTDDPALDLAVVASILSSNEDIAISEKYCFAGEIGLSGEIRPVPQIEHRITEAEKLGYDKIYVSNLNKIPKRKFAIKIEEVSKIEDFHERLF
ncbi:DNA repair protein RadA [Elizabethkingia anophelis]|uniref:DNA repair protein RadA n=1 Tax=Elizabethkingia anophelis NUHP1 TaxID=1338011 RepID=A0A077EDQ5_9FLAO|nr:DNA repair protein RadA [Elizabethkingia anophelis]AIL44334.1 DNA repair protein RadA [Elizabethkingia anophelis NUHP1]MBE9394789.1 DNA repair protein RadA [Elizabethkingia anophelis]MBE9406591.1 DNA repair protein RadA [Elizabethkingia anophelis]MCT3833585.1 DNA repair protein RadA [Elizabethkingia anophelis]MCT3976954.1 DNA repair protein RadA [Elizabethkingia anophelis]